MLSQLVVALLATTTVLAQGFSAGLLNVVKAFTPSVPVQPEHWDGLEFRYNRMIFRPSQFKIEGTLLGLMATYFILWFAGKTRNYRRAMAWFEAHMPLLESQFSSPQQKSGSIVQDGACDFFNYSTGRRGVRSLHTTAALLPRQDIISLLWHYMWMLYDLTYMPKDEIQLDFTLQLDNPTPPFVWAMIKKDEMAEMRRKRFDLGFTKGSEFPGLPSDICVFSEAADISESILKFTSSLSFVEILRDPKINKYFRSLIITDQPAEKPYEGPLPAEERSRHIILTLCSPPPTEGAVTLPLVKEIFTLIDVLDAKLPLRPETKTKLKVRREALEEELKKEAKKEKNEELEENKRSAKRKTEEDKLSKLTATEQKKFEERERKRSLRKQQGKMVTRRGA